MPRLFQQLLSMSVEGSSRDAREGDASSIPDDDIALGFECATPALQFDAWDPAPLPPTPTPAY